jgi:hypothetical protein
LKPSRQLYRRRDSSIVAPGSRVTYIDEFGTTWWGVATSPVLHDGPWPEVHVHFDHDDAATWPSRRVPARDVTTVVPMHIHLRAHSTGSARRPRRSRS